MLRVLLSPSKSQDYERDLMQFSVREPSFFKESQVLLENLRTYSVPEIEKLMSISEKLADLNFKRFLEMSAHMTIQNSRACLQAFTGDVYSGFDLNEYSKKDYEYADKVIRIISGFYGVLKPLDFIQAYRLEMKTKLPVYKSEEQIAKNLYEFWGSQLTEYLESEGGDVVNLASKEYSAAIDFSGLSQKVLDVDFYEIKNGQPKIVAIYAKKARGVMADWIVRCRIENLQEIQKFDFNGYKFDTINSTEKHFKFVRS
jgi:uncharacterized protein